MDSLITLVMNDSPLTVNNRTPKEKILILMENQDLLHMPIVDRFGKLCNLKTLHHLIEKSTYANPVFIMAGGFGTRLYPLTEVKPKPMLNVGGNPILETIINRFVDAGFHNFYISTHYKSEVIQNYFGDGSDRNITIEYLYEEIPLGTAGSLGLLPKKISKLPIIIMNGDLLTKINFENLLDFHSKSECPATMCVREYDFQVPYGVVDIKEQKVIDILEKPVQSFFINAGIYVLNYDLISKIDGKSYIDMPNFLKSNIKSGDNVNVFPIHEYWIDIGIMEEYERANKDIDNVLL